MIRLLALCSLLLTLSPGAPAQRTGGGEALWEASWRNPDFIKRFQGSYGFDGPREPTISPAEQQLFVELGGLLEAGNLAAAIARLQPAIGSESSAALDYTLGNLHYQRGQLGAAERAYREALRKSPGFVRAQRNLGFALMQAGKIEEARTWLLETLRRGGGDGTVYGLLAYGYFQEGKYLSALGAYQEALVFQPDRETWLSGRAQALYALGQYREAAGALEELLQKHPGRVDFWLLQANAWLALEQPGRAATNLEVVRRLGGSSAGADLLRGDLFLSQGLDGLATKAYLEAIKREPPPRLTEALRVANQLATRRAWVAVGEVLEAMETVYQTALEADQAEAWMALRVQLNLAVGDPQETAAILRDWLDREPLNGRALLLLAEVEWKRGELEEAALLFERAARIPAVEAEALVEHARMDVGEGRYGPAAERLRRAQELRPRENVGRYLEQVERARRLAQ